MENIELQKPWSGLVTGLRWALFFLSGADLVALKSGAFSHSPFLLATLMAGTMLAFAGHLFRLMVQGILRRRFSGRLLSQLMVSTGVLVCIGGGMANWMLGLQGYVILNEGEKVRLRGGSELQAFDAGPLAKIEEMNVVLSLDEMDLVPFSADSFLPVSHLRMWRGHNEPASLEINPRRSDGAGPLRFHQGAFGFAPRIVILKGTDPIETVFDRVVPFLSERRGPTGVFFNGSFTLGEERLKVEGSVDLASLDEGMRGHATLHLMVRRDDEVLGRGALAPGHFADIDPNYRLGFAGLEKWSEIVVSRRNYGSFVLAGAVIALLGAVVWLIARWRGGR